MTEINLKAPAKMTSEMMRSIMAVKPHKRLDRYAKNMQLFKVVNGIEFDPLRHLEECDIAVEDNDDVLYTKIQAETIGLQALQMQLSMPHLNIRASKRLSILIKMYSNKNLSDADMLTLATCGVYDGLGLAPLPDTAIEILSDVVNRGIPYRVGMEKDLN